MLVVPSRADALAHPLDTSRLTLAPLDSSDASDLWSTIDEGRAALEKWLPWVPFTVDRDSTKRYCDACAADWDGARACRLSIRAKTPDRKLLGVVGLESMVHLHRSAELGYWLRSDGTGRGYMTEAATAVLDWGFNKVQVHRIRVAAATDNHASLAVIRRLGFRFEGIARQAEQCQERWLDHAVFALLAADFPYAAQNQSRGSSNERNL